MNKQCGHTIANGLMNEVCHRIHIARIGEAEVVDNGIMTQAEIRCAQKIHSLIVAASRDVQLPARFGGQFFNDSQLIRVIMILARLMGDIQYFVASERSGR